MWLRTFFLTEIIHKYQLDFPKKLTHCRNLFFEVKGRKFGKCRGCTSVFSKRSLDAEKSQKRDPLLLSRYGKVLGTFQIQVTMSKIKVKKMNKLKMNKKGPFSVSLLTFTHRHTVVGSALSTFSIQVCSLLTVGPLPSLPCPS